ncbi:hypothetical protein SAMN05216296_0033 [Pseudomonas pohangensis]|uniref:Uncharacterized protein n=2 Tax=Pseudomonas pohangensis TaxID=364197 RepID=A0A1H2DUZ8_9PSED|nr:hypothetical protein SAMN05216296_0033 [Pseudomonas pohangensis]
MALRQAGAPIETANEIVAGGPEAFEELVKRIYTAPVLENKEKQKDLIKASYTKWLNECLSVI